MWGNDAELKDALRRGVDMHLFNAINLAGGQNDMIGWLRGTLNTTNTRPICTGTPSGKPFIHGTNYGGEARNNIKQQRDHNT